MSTEPKIVSGHEHPSGLREAIATVAEKAVRVTPFLNADKLTDRMLEAFTAWLSVVSEGEIEAAARAMYDYDSTGPIWNNLTDGERAWYRRMGSLALAASRGVLVPKETRT